MRRLDILFGLLFLAVIGIGLYAINPRRSLVRNRDAEVIEAAMLEFFQKRDWTAGDWDQGEYVVIDPKGYGEYGRGKVGDCIDNVIEQYERDPKKKGAIAELKRLKALHPDGPNAAEEPLVPLAKLDLDQRILVRKYQCPFFREDRKPIKDRYGQPGMVRVDGSIGAPCYSTDGQVAFVGMNNVPWSARLSATLGCLLVKEKGKWKVKDVRTVFWV